MSLRGSLPPQTKRKTLKEDDPAVQPPKKRTRKCKDKAPEKRKSGHSGGSKEKAVEGTATATVASPKFNRFEGLLSEPRKTTLSQTPVREKEINVRESRLGKQTGLVDLPVEVFCEVCFLLFVHKSEIDLLSDNIATCHFGYSQHVSLDSQVP